MADQPIGIANLIMEAKCKYSRHPIVWMPDYWLWCRSHKQAHKAGTRCVCRCATDGDNERCAATGSACIDVGPFMTEREANRMRGDHNYLQPSGFNQPLGMDIER